MALRIASERFICRQCRMNALSIIPRRGFNSSAPIVERDPPATPMLNLDTSSRAPTRPHNTPANTPSPSATPHSRPRTLGTAHQSKLDATHPPPAARPPPSHSARYSLARLPPTALAPPTFTAPLRLTPSLRAHLPHLAAQPPHYITVHIHGFPYLVTAGDTLRLPFLLHGVMPGDVLRLNRAGTLGSRDWTLRAGSRADALEKEESGVESPAESVAAAEHDPASGAGMVIGRTNGLDSRPVPQPGVDRQRLGDRRPYLDERLFTVRAVVMGTESEPLRIKEKTKQRQRRVKRVKSKHRFTILKIREVKVHTLAELETAQTVETVDA